MAIVLDKRWAISAPFAWWVTAVVFIFTAAIAWAHLKAQVDSIPAITARIESHSTALSKLDVMANDIQWIKDELVRRRQEEYRRLSSAASANDSRHP